MFNMNNQACEDCQDTCSQMHPDYDPTSCKLSNGDPCEECCALAVLDDHISQVHAQLNELARKRRFLKTRINYRHEPFIHRLPVEISANIFATYVQDIDSAFELLYTEGLEDWSPALHLSSICVGWRNFARSTAQIWRVIRVPLLRRRVNVELLGELMTELFSLSGHHTLSLSVYQWYSKGSDDNDHLFRAHLTRLRSLDDLLIMTRAVTSRCNDITLYGLPLKQIQKVFGSADTSNLKKIRILEPYGRFEGYDFPSRQISLRASPQLEEVEITSGARLLPNVEINWQNITTAKIEYLSPNNGFKILQYAPRLKTCRIFCGEYKPPEDNTLWPSLPLNLPLTHTRLESFDFYAEGDEMAQFLQAVNFPSLKELTFMAPQDDDNSSVEKLIHFFQRSPCPLTSLSLTLYDNPVDGDIGILNLLETIPTVAHLTLKGPHDSTIMTNTFLEEFIKPTPPRPTVTPRLETFSYTGPMKFTWPALLKIFDSPPTPTPDSDSLVKKCYQRPLREISLRLNDDEERRIIIDDNVLSRLRGIQSAVKLKIVANGRTKVKVGYQG